MVLSSLNSGRHLSGRRQRDRMIALRDRTGYTPSQLFYLDVSGAQGGGRFNPIFYEIETQPLVPQTPTFAVGKKRISIKDNPKIGD